MTIFETRESNIRAYSRTYPTVFATADNARQTDEAGKSYIDFFAGAGVLNFGHNNPRMVQAMIDYLQHNGVLHSLDMQTQAKAEFMQAFTDIILQPRGMPHRMQFVGPTGTNAVEAALKLARRVTGRQQVIAFSRGFHGMTLGALAATANQYFRNAAGIPLLHVRHEPFDDLHALQQLMQRYADASSGLTPPAAFLVETIQAEGGVNVASKAWIQALAEQAKSLGALLIVDDIQVGCGRTGHYFSFDDLDIQPDIVTLAKGLGGVGTPIAMNLIHPDLDQHWSPGEHTGTFRGQNLSFVAGKQALHYFETTDLMQSVTEKAQQVRQQLAPLLASYPTFELRGKGLILGLDVVEGAVAAAIVQQCFQQGLIIAACGTGGRVLKLIPPLTIPMDDLRSGLDILIQAVHSVMEAPI